MRMDVYIRQKAAKADAARVISRRRLEVAATSLSPDIEEVMVDIVRLSQKAVDRDLSHRVSQACLLAVRRDMERRASRRVVSQDGSSPEQMSTRELTELASEINPRAFTGLCEWASRDWQFAPDEREQLLRACLQSLVRTAPVFAAVDMSGDEANALPSPNVEVSTLIPRSCP